MSQLSVVIITYNEGENIADCIRSVKDIADEVIVVDSFSSDKTAEIAKQYGARVLQREFEGYVKQKNWANQQAAFPFVLSLDGDEYLSSELKNSIASIKSEFKFDAYSMNRLNFYRGRPIRTCGWYPDTKIRLWNNSKGVWTGQIVHEKLELEKGASVAHLRGDILHNTYPTYESLINQVEKFANLSAQQLRDSSNLYLYCKLAFSAPFKFVRNYFFNLGFTEGADGVKICYSQSLEIFLKYYWAIKMKGK